MSRPRTVPSGAEALGKLGEYQILKKLATGGMAEIYLARASRIEGFQKHAVLKVIRDEFASDPHFVTMFLDEARLAAGLHHQNIAQVYDIGREEHILFFAMEYLHGVDLRKLLRTLVQRRELIPLKHALTIAARAAAGLHYAHQRVSAAGKPLDIVHRDVSPSNVVVTYDGGVKVVDFGIARATERSAETRTGSLKGKISYMSPEQCLGKPLDRRSDVFSFGIVLYELTTRTRLLPQRGESDFVIMKRIVEGAFERPSARVDGYPDRLEAIVMRALAVDPGERYQTMQELLLDLEALAAQQRLLLSAEGLALYLESVFGRPPEPWLDLHASQASSDTGGPDASEESPTISLTPRSGASRLEEAETSETPSLASSERVEAAPRGGADPVVLMEGSASDISLRRRRSKAVVPTVFLAIAAAGAAAWFLWIREAPQPEPQESPARPAAAFADASTRPADAGGIATEWDRDQDAMTGAGTTPSTAPEPSDAAVIAPIATPVDAGSRRVRKRSAPKRPRKPRRDNDRASPEDPGLGGLLERDWK